MIAPPCAPPREETLGSGEERLHLEHFSPPGPPLGRVVTVHGFAAHCALYRHVAAALAGQGFAVTQFDCRGHGRSAGPRGHVASFDHYVDDLAAVLARARELTPHGPLAIVAHSFGATIALDAVLRGRAAPDVMVAVTPYLRLAMPVPAYKRALAPILSRLWPTLAMHNELRAEDVSRNPLVIANFDKDPLVHHVATSRWFCEAVAAQDRILASAAALRVPTLLLVAGGDRIVSVDAQLAFAAAASGVVEVRRYEGCYHELYLEPERERVIADIGAWLRAAVSDLAPAPSGVPVIL